MSEYSAEDFAAAQFAIDPSKESPFDRCWMRSGIGVAPWSDALATLRSDEQMARTGCIPVYAEPYSQEALQRAWEHGEKQGAFAEEGVSYVWLNGKGRYTLFADDGSKSPLIPGERAVYRQHSRATDIDVEWELSARCSVCPNRVGDVQREGDGLVCQDCGTRWNIDGRNGERAKR